eukprot:5922132-Ditylum_brightwellii.AAC.1
MAVDKIARVELSIAAEPQAILPTNSNKHNATIVAKPKFTLLHNNGTSVVLVDSKRIKARWIKLLPSKMIT